MHVENNSPVSSNLSSRPAVTLPSPLVGAAAVFAAAPLHAAGGPADVADLIARLRSPDDAVRGPAWQSAAPFGAPAVKPLAAVMSDDDFEIARAARRALWVIVRFAGRPGAARERVAVAKELIGLLGSSPVPVRREAGWMLSEIGDDAAVPAMAALLGNTELRQDALCGLMRLPGRRPTAAMQHAFGRAPEEFKYALAHALRKRGESVKGYPSESLVPTRRTAVTHPVAS
jgi:HEAT repeat protein